MSPFLQALSSCVRAGSKPLCYLRFSVQKRGIVTSFAGSPENVTSFINRSDPNVRDMIVKNNVLLPDFSALGQTPLYKTGQQHPLLQQLSPHSKVVPVIAVAGLSEKRWRETLSDIQSLGSCINHVLIVKGYHQDTIKSDPYIDQKYQEVNRELQTKGIETAAVLNIHETPSAVERELRFKHALGFTTYYTQPVYDPANTLPAATLEHIAKLVRQGVGLQVGLFLPTGYGYAGRKFTPGENRIAVNGNDRHLMPATQQGEDPEDASYATRVISSSITWAKLLRRSSPTSKVDVYTRIGKNKPSALVYQLLAIQAKEFDLRNMRKPVSTGGTVFVTD
ncbi:MAG: hypothetical protein A3J38_07390 [Gammaproteobacteria bacterium RIFCSPHIGHO2_12_FULL_45_9]|nr:MAG: hypothetical protein A3J38_07390 [Gammaproteobacteria bacterium RIFCSPHIGHO2_12_FULL_45_9]